MASINTIYNNTFSENSKADLKRQWNAQDNTL